MVNDRLLRFQPSSKCEIFLFYPIGFPLAHSEIQRSEHIGWVTLSKSWWGAWSVPRKWDLTGLDQFARLVQSLWNGRWSDSGHRWPLACSDLNQFTQQNLVVLVDSGVALRSYEFMGSLLVILLLLQLLFYIAHYIPSRHLLFTWVFLADSLQLLQTNLLAKPLNETYKSCALFVSMFLSTQRGAIIFLKLNYTQLRTKGP